MASFEQISDFDVFFYHGQNELELENESDILWSLIQERRTMYYNRQEGIPSVENNPNAISLEVLLRYSISNYLAWRNTQVGDGTNNTKDRRVAVSQNSIIFDRDARKGDLDVIVYYIPYVNFKEPQNIKVPIGRGI
jgi:hypothetical protein